MTLSYKDSNYMQPFVRVSSGESENAIKARCKELALFQLEYWPQELWQRRPSILKLVEDFSAREMALNRIGTMIDCLRLIMETNVSPKRLEEFHRIEWSRDHSTASTPMLLAIGALLNSHRQWTQANFHDIYSAVAVEDSKDLSEKWPQWLIDRISLLVALKNVYRTCIGELVPRELGVWQGTDVKFEAEAIRTALGQFLWKVWPSSVSVDALLLVAVAYQARFRGEVKFEVFNDFTQKLKDSITLIERGELEETYSGTLAIFEFGRHLFPEIPKAKLKSSAQKILTGLLGDSSPPIVWISFDRFWATRHPQGLALWVMSSTNPSNFFEKVPDIEQPKSLTRDLGQLRFYRLNLELEKEKEKEKHHAFKVAFACEENQCELSPNPTVWDLIKVPIELFLKRREDTNKEPMLPWAYVMQVLYVLGHIYHDEFFKLRVIRPDSPPKLGSSNIIMLPNKPPKIEELEKALKDENWKEPKLIVVRCLAALLSNQRMAFGNRQQILDADINRGVVDKWKESAEWFATNNQHSALTRYIQTFLTPKVQIETTRPSIESSIGESEVQARIAGLDIGATYIKAAIYEYHPETETLGKKMLEEMQLNTQLTEEEKESYKKEKYEKDCKFFIQRLDQELQKKWNEKLTEEWKAFKEEWNKLQQKQNQTKVGEDELQQTWNKLQQTWDKLQQTWAEFQQTWAEFQQTWAEFQQKVDKLQQNWEKEQQEQWDKLKKEWNEKQKRGYKWSQGLVAIGLTWPGAIAGEPGYEYIASFSSALGYFDIEKKFYKLSADEIHQVELREAVQEYFNLETITLMNDAIAHVLYYRWQFNRELLSTGETLVGLFAGTGTGEAVLDGDTGLPVRVIAELGRFIIDIACPFPLKDEFPAGTSRGRTFFNKDTLPTLATQLLQKKASLPKMPRLQIAWFKWKGYGKIKKLSEALKKLKKLEEVELNEIEQHLSSNPTNSPEKELKPCLDNLRNIVKTIAQECNQETPELPESIQSISQLKEELKKIKADLPINQEKIEELEKTWETLKEELERWDGRQPPNWQKFLDDLIKLIESCGIEVVCTVPALLLGWILEGQKLEEELEELQKELEEELEELQKELKEKLNKLQQKFEGEDLTKAQEEAKMKSKAAEEKIEDLWKDETPAGATSCDSALDIGICLNELKDALGEEEVQKFAKEVAEQAGWRLADLIAQARELYSSINFFAGGGPMSGATGWYIRRYAREELEKGYGFDVVKETNYNVAPTKHHLTRLIRFPEPYTDVEPPGPSGSRGAAIAAQALFSDLSKSKAHPGVASFSTFSVIELNRKVKGTVLFPNVEYLLDSKGKINTVGYVRSYARASKSTKVNKEKRSVYDHPLPWRDYDKKVLIEKDKLIEIIKNNDQKDKETRNHFIISARNTINEWGYQVRLDGEWRRRLDDEEVIKDDWPVLTVSEERVRLLPYKDAQKEAELVTGIPLVSDGKPKNRMFLIGNCSDVTHVYEVHPKGWLGPSAVVWRELSECWQRAKDQGAEDYLIAQRMEKLASYYGVKKSYNLLHSVIAERYDESLVAFAITGALDEIAEELASNWHVRHALLLDNGGSVGWQTLIPAPKGKYKETLLVAGPNYRPRGLVFIDLWVEEFIHPRRHPVLLRKTGGEG